LRDLTKDNVIELVHCRSEEQLADILTKPLKFDNFCKLREGLGICDLNEFVNWLVQQAAIMQARARLAWPANGLGLAWSK
ncbi:hypothetical protein L195_g050881, partial [Trifolium pratense]